MLFFVLCRPCSSFGTMFLFDYCSFGTSNGLALLFSINIGDLSSILLIISNSKMPRSIASAPGKVILFGEHAVVYGVTAIAAALSDLRIVVQLVLYIDSDS